MSCSSPVSRVLSELRQEIQPSRLLPALFAGSIIGATMVLWSVTIAALVFNGVLEPFLVRGTGYFLFGSMILALVMALMSSYPGMIAGSDEAAAIILSLAASALAAVMLPTADLELVFATVMMVIVVSTLLSGLVFLSLGQFRLGNLVRFIPLPVVGGVVVTMGWLIVVGAFGVMIDQDIDMHTLSSLAHSENIIRWLPGAAFAVALVAATRTSSHYLVLPAMFAIAIGLFYLLTAVFEFPVEELEAGGWLVGPFPDQSLWVTMDTSMLHRVDWGLVAAQADSVGSLILLCLLGLLLSATGIEVVMKRDMDLNRELVSAGIANVLAALGGGVTGSHSVEDSLLAREINASYRLTGIITALVCLLALVFGISFLSYLPKTLLGGFILFFGLILMIEWVYEGWFKLPWADYTVVVLCLLVSASVGYLQGITVGIFAGAIIFVFNYSRVDVIKHALSGIDYHSNVERDGESQKILIEQGDRICLLVLEGFIFFGTSHKVLTWVKERLADRSRPALGYLILDFRNVSDVDTSTVSSFIRMKHLAEQAEFRILMTSLSGEILSSLSRGEVIEQDDPVIQVFSNTDRGLEWCEQQLLDAVPGNAGVVEMRLFDRLSRLFSDRDQAALLMTYLDLQYVEEGEYLIRQGDDSSDLYFIESGRVTVQFEMRSQEPVRVHTMGAGTVVGEVALYLGIPRSASVVAEVPSVVYCLTKNALEKMKEDPALEAEFHAFVVRLVASRLAATNKLVNALHG